MNDDRVKIEQRMQNMKNFYLKIGEIIDKLPDGIPDKVKKTLHIHINVKTKIEFLWKF